MISSQLTQKYGVCKSRIFRILRAARIRCHLIEIFQELLARRTPHIATNYSRCNFQGKSLWHISNARHRTSLFVVEGVEIPQRMSHREVANKNRCEFGAAKSLAKAGEIPSRLAWMDSVCLFLRHSLMTIMSRYTIIQYYKYCIISYTNVTHQRLRNLR